MFLGRGNPSEIRLTLIDLERALKQEGLYKILKSEFSTIKKSFLEVSSYIKLQMLVLSMFEQCFSRLHVHNANLSPK